MSRRFHDRQPHPPYHGVPPQVQTPYVPGRTVTKVRKDTNHTFHLLTTLVTVGVWGAVVWLPLTLWHRIGPRERFTTSCR